MVGNSMAVDILANRITDILHHKGTGLHLQDMGDRPLRKAMEVRRPKDTLHKDIREPLSPRNYVLPLIL